MPDHTVGTGKPRPPEGTPPIPAGWARGGLQVTRVGYGTPEDRAVVVTADRVVAATAEIIAACGDPDRPRLRGDLERDGDLVWCGTPGEGLGRLTYRIVDSAPGWHLLVREETDGVG